MANRDQQPNPGRGWKIWGITSIVLVILLIAALTYSIFSDRKNRQTIVQLAKTGANEASRNLCHLGAFAKLHRELGKRLEESGLVTDEQLGRELATLQDENPDVWRPYLSLSYQLKKLEGEATSQPLDQFILEAGACFRQLSENQV